MKRKIMYAGLVLFMFCSIFTQAQAGLISEWRFDGNAKDSAGNNHGKIIGNATWGTDRYGEANKALALDGKSYVDCGNDVNLSFGDGTTDRPFSIEWWQKSNTGAPAGILQKWGGYDMGWSNAFRIRIEDVNNNCIQAAAVGVSLQTTGDKWTNIVFTYDGSGSSKGFKFYQDGKPCESLIETDRGPYTAMSPKNAPLIIGKSVNGTYYFNGLIDDLRIYNHVLSPAEIETHYSGVSQVSVQEKMKDSEDSFAALEKRAGSLPLSGSDKIFWVQAVNAELSPLKKEMESIKNRNFIISWPEKEEIDRMIDLSVRRLNLLLTAAAEGKIKNRDYLAYVTPPISSTTILPDSVLEKPSDEIRLTATPGEYEPGSFVVTALSALNSLKITATDLERGKELIPSANIDIKVVKCWYQSPEAPGSLVSNRSKKVILPELLLNDDSLVKVDYEKKENYLKVVHARGTSSQQEEYLWISNPADVPAWQFIPVEDYPVQDSPVLLPVSSVPAMRNQQFWVTVKVPENAGPGLYTGKINLSTPEKYLGFLTLSVKVMPFKLASPKTYYDLNRDFICSLTYRGFLDPSHPEGNIGSFPRSAQQLKAEMKDMFNHGITDPVAYYDGYYQDLESFNQYLKIREDAGMTGPLFLGAAAGTGNPQDESGLNSLKDRVKKAMAAAKNYGISEVYFYGIDETGGEQLKSQRPAWKAVHEAGGKVFATISFASPKSDEAFVLTEMGDILDWFMHYGISKKVAEEWHSLGHKIGSEANPMAGIENPEIYRRNKGLLPWKNNYDFTGTYGLHTSYGNTWNDFDFSPYRDHNFTYPTENGVIDTIAFEGYREAIDDIKYGTTLKLEIEKAKKSGNKEAGNLALAAEEYLEKLDTDGDLDAIRLKIIDYILKLQQKVK